MLTGSLICVYTYIMEWFLIREWPAVDCTVGSGFLWQPLPIGIYIVPVTDDDDKVALVKETQVEAASSSSEHNVETAWLPAVLLPFPHALLAPGVACIFTLSLRYCSLVQS